MSYIEEKKINGKKYLYLSKNVRVSKGKWKKVRKYLGKDLSGLDIAEKEIEQSIIRLMTLKQMKIIDFIREKYIKEINNQESLWTVEEDKFISFIYNTNAIEGNSLGYEETKDVLDGKKPIAQYSQRDIDEIKNMKKCIDFLREYNGDFNKKLLLKLHKIQMNKVHSEAGEIRIRQNIVGNYLPPKPELLKKELNDFFHWYDLAKDILHPFELATLVHLKIARIHPFIDGNGRISRLLMNFILIKNSYPLLNIFDSEKMLYYLKLKEVDFKKKEKPFVKYLYDIYLEQYQDYLK
jgi:Fic family protein